VLVFASKTSVSFVPYYKKVVVTKDSVQAYQETLESTTPLRCQAFMRSLGHTDSILKDVFLYKNNAKMEDCSLDFQI
jgi:hypothetical protein